MKEQQGGTTRTTSSLPRPTVGYFSAFAFVARFAVGFAFP